jgi:hypothetical protein
MMTENGMWCCSVDDDEHFGPAQFETREAALRDAMQMAEEEGGETIYIGRIQEYVPQVNSYAGNMLEYVQEDAYEEGGEYAETYLNDVTPEDEADLGQMLQAAFNSWLEKHPEYEPGRCFSLVTDVEAIDVSSNNDDEPCDDQKDSDYYEDKG